MKYRTFANKEQLSAIGLGCMSMSHAYGVPDDPESIETLHLALDLGINFWDTADVYGNGKNEELISNVLRTNRDKIFIATKFGFRATDIARNRQGLCQDAPRRSFLCHLWTLAASLSQSACLVGMDAISTRRA